MTPGRHPGTASTTGGQGAPRVEVDLAPSTGLQCPQCVLGSAGLQAGAPPAPRSPEMRPLRQAGEKGDSHRGPRGNVPLLCVSPGSAPTSPKPSGPHWPWGSPIFSSALPRRESGEGSPPTQNQAFCGSPGQGGPHGSWVRGPGDGAPAGPSLRPSLLPHPSPAPGRWLDPGVPRPPAAGARAPAGQLRVPTANPPISF